MKIEAQREASAAKRTYQDAGGVGDLVMSRAAFFSIHTDFRSTRGMETHPSCLVLLGGGTTLVPVTFRKG